MAIENDDPRELKGEVHSFSAGFGYILGEDGKLYIVDATGIDEADAASANPPPLQAAEKVEFNSWSDEGVAVAIGVRKIKRKSD